jgi:hypothetical protein
MSGGINEIALANELMNKTLKIAVKQHYTMKKVSKNKETGKPKEIFINTQIYRIISSELNTFFLTVDVKLLICRCHLSKISES